MTYGKIQWAIIFIVSFIDIVWISLGSFSLHYSIKNFVVFAILIAFLFFPYLFYKKYRPHPEILTALQASLIFLFSSLPFGVLSYLAYTTNFPLVDEYLAYVDGRLGVYSPSIVFLFRSHEFLYLLFGIIYDVYYAEFLFIIIYFSFRGEGIDVYRFLMNFIIASLLTILMGSLLPAAGPYVWYHYIPSDELQQALNRLVELRNNVLNISKGDGIVTIPSFHTIMALIFTYTFRNQSKRIFIPILILNLFVIFSCLPIGQHYLADLLGGTLVFFVVIGIEKLIFWAVYLPPDNL